MRRCFQKAGFIIPEVPLIDEVDEDADDDPLLSMEADVSTPPETNAIDLMQEDLLKGIIDGNSENDCSTSAEDISNEDQQLKSTVITPCESSKLLVDIEGFFVSRALHEEASIVHENCSRHFKEDETK